MKNLFFVILLFSFVDLSSQSLFTQVVNTTGGYFASNSGSLEFNVGEIAIQHYPTTTLTEGLLQPEDSVDNTNQVFETFDISLYPNPAQTEIYFETEKEGIDLVLLYGSDGKLVISQKWQPKCKLPYLASGIYFVALLNKEKQLLWHSKLSIIQP